MTQIEEKRDKKKPINMVTSKSLASYDLARLLTVTEVLACHP
jgi:hypothetical protein